MLKLKMKNFGVLRGHDSPSVRELVCRGAKSGVDTVPRAVLVLFTRRKIPVQPINQHRAKSYPRPEGKPELKKKKKSEGLPWWHSG